jgi:hypothetical protein
VVGQHREAVTFPYACTERVEPDGSGRETVVEPQHVDGGGVVVVNVTVVNGEQPLLHDEDLVSDAVVRRPVERAVDRATGEPRDVRR